MKSQIGLGVLAIPSVFHTLGLAPGIICLIVIGALTTWTDYYIGVFKLKHPSVCTSCRTRWNGAIRNPAD